MVFFEGDSVLGGGVADNRSRGSEATEEELSQAGYHLVAGLMKRARMPGRIVSISSHRRMISARLVRSSQGHKLLSPATEELCLLFSEWAISIAPGGNSSD